MFGPFHCQQKNSINSDLDVVKAVDPLGTINIRNIRHNVTLKKIKYSKPNQDNSQMHSNLEKSTPRTSLTSRRLSNNNRNKLKKELKTVKICTLNIKNAMPSINNENNLTESKKWKRKFIKQQKTLDKIIYNGILVMKGEKIKNSSTPLRECNTQGDASQTKKDRDRIIRPIYLHHRIKSKSTLKKELITNNWVYGCDNLTGNSFEESRSESFINYLLSMRQAEPYRSQVNVRLSQKANKIHLRTLARPTLI